MEFETGKSLPQEASAESKEIKKPRHRKRPAKFSTPLPIIESLIEKNPETIKKSPEHIKVEDEKKKETYQLPVEQLYAGEGIISLDSDIREHVIMLNEVQTLAVPEAPARGPANAQELEHVFEQIAQPVNKPETLKPAAVEAEPEQVNLPPNRRLETSAWHRIEIDTKTGKAVENPTLEYGAEYYRERRQEAAPHEDIDKAAGVAAVVATSQDQTITSPVDIPNIPDATVRQPLTGTSEPTQRTSRPSSQATDGPLWPYVVGLVVVFLGLFLALR